MPLRLSAVLLVALVALGCDGEGGDDAGADAGVDAGRHPAPRAAAPPMCAPACDPTDACCDVGGGATECFDLRNDSNHCGECTVDCIRERRGDGCAAGQCTCGLAPLGCDGTMTDTCCPPRGDGGGQPYCANLMTSAADCGECDRGCDPREADRCDGALCRCGAGREPCAGTPEDTCCVDGVDVDCIDTTTDRFHCGSCNNLCQSGERCEESSCTFGDSCAGGCGDREICCDGTCCTRRACMAGTCGMPRPDDAGVPDAGPGDAGPADAGPGDGGPDDAGADAG